MPAIKTLSNDAVAEVLANYPDNIQLKLVFLRELIFETATEMDEVGNVDETLKWGEPAYSTKHGSTIRMGGKESSPEHYFLYFHCQSILIDTFKTLYHDELNFEGNRAIKMHIDDELPVNTLKHCISLALSYHRVKQLPMLGA